MDMGLEVVVLPVFGRGPGQRVLRQVWGGGLNTGMRPLVAHHAIEVDQPRDAISAGIEDVTAAGAAGIAVGHAAVLN